MRLVESSPCHVANSMGYIHSCHVEWCKMSSDSVGIENNKVRYLAAIFIQLNSHLQRGAKSEANGVRVA